MEKKLIDLEEYFKAGKEIPKGQEYKFRVDKKTVTTTEENLTGRQILEKADYIPAENYLLRQITKGNQKLPIDLGQNVDLTEPGIERFVTIPKDPTDGDRT